jgi:hypothetical protein
MRQGIPSYRSVCWARVQASLLVPRRGHRVLINKEDSTLRKLEKRYANECFDACEQCLGEVVAAVALGTAVAVGTTAAMCLAPEVTIPALLLGTAAATR